MPIFVRASEPNICSCPFRPEAVLQYEHMFSSTDTPPFARRLFAALHLIRSFLLLEDDYDVDWEVDQDEPIESPGCDSRSSGGRETDQSDHPHRVALQGRRRVWRAGALAPREQVCLCPLPQRGRRSEIEPQRGSRITTGNVRVVIDR
jgi:hypothetical protein